MSRFNGLYTLCVPWMVNINKFSQQLRESPESASLSFAGVTPGNISKPQSLSRILIGTGLERSMQWSKRITKYSWTPLKNKQPVSILQKSELTDRNGIRGIVVWVSKHIIAKPNEYKKYSYVDSAGLDGRTFTLPREVSEVTSWQNGEVSRSHSTLEIRADEWSGGLITKGRTER